MSTSVAVYIAEASPAHLRGRLVSLQSVLITLGRFCGALASAVAFSLAPLATGRKQPVLVLTNDLLAGAGKKQLSPSSRYTFQWVDVLNFSSRRFSISLLSLCWTFVSIALKKPSVVVITGCRLYFVLSVGSITFAHLSHILFFV